MYMNRTKETRTEPQDCELIADDEECRELILTYVVENGDLPTNVIAIDDYTEEDIELEVSEYLDNGEIDLLNDILQDELDFDLIQLTYIINNLKFK